MSIEVGIMISVINVCFAIYFGYSNKRASDKAGMSKQIVEQTAMYSKLEFISNDIKDIKNEISSVRLEQSKQNERLIRLEESDKVQWREINKLKGDVKNECN